MSTSVRRWAAAVAAVACASMIVAGCSRSDDDVATTVMTTDTTTVTTGVPSSEAPPASTGSRVPITVNTEGLGTELAPGSLQRWAADVSNGNESTVIAKCWTIAPDYVRARYFADVPTVAAIFAQRPQSGQAGVSWGTWGGAYAHVPWDEAKSGYSCPRITLKSGEHLYSNAFVAYIAKRFILRAQGKPVNPADTEANYHLECIYAPGEIRDVARGDANQIAVTREDLPHGDARWTVRSGPLTMQMAIEPGTVCVKSAS